MSLGSDNSMKTGMRFHEKYSKQIVNALPDMLLVVNQEGVIVDVVAHLCPVHFGDATEEQLLNSDIKEVLPPEAYENVKSNVLNVVSTGEVSVGQHAIIKENKIRYFENTVTPLDEGYYLCAFRDVTKRISAFTEMETMKRALSKAQEGIIATSLDGTFYFANERFKNQFHLSDEDFKKCTLLDLLNEETAVLWRNMVQSVRAGNSEEKYLVPMTTAAGDSAIYEIFANIQFDPFGNEVIWHFIRDISLRLEQENEITRLNRLMNAILNNIPVFLFVKDCGDDFRYLYWNRSFAEFSGIREKDAIGKNDFELFPNRADMERFRAEDIEVLEKGRLAYEREARYPNGEIRTTTTLKTTILSGDTHPYIIGVSWDITDIKKAQAELMEARIKAEEADHMKSAFLANMSHEIRTPLNAIVGFSKLAIEAKEEEEKWMYIDIVEKNTKLLLNLFNDILDLAAIESDALQLTKDPVLLHELCREQYELNRHTVQYGVKLFLDDSDEELSILTDWNRVSQVLMNLLSNAVKFTQEGEIHFGYKLQQDFVQFHVKDTGIGISADKIGAVFKRFGKVNNFVQGTGLGLTICRMLVEKMGGRIWVRSKENEGTTFYFTIPIE